MMQVVDWQRIVFARRRVIHAVRFLAGMKPALTRLAGRIGRIGRMLWRTAFTWLRRVWRGGWIVSWEGGKTRVFWRGGNPD